MQPDKKAAQGHEIESQVELVKAGVDRAEVERKSPPASAAAEKIADKGDEVGSRKAAAPRKKKGKGRYPNNVRKIRIERMMSKAELARRATLSVLTIDRVEKGFGCRMDTKRKILEALGLELSDRVKVFGEEE